MGKFWHEDGFEQAEPGNPIVRTRVFEPEDTKFRTPDEIRARIQELKEKRDAMDPKVAFCGLRRLGESYTVVEPFVYFDGPTKEQRKLYYHLTYFVTGLFTMVGTMMYYKTRGGAYLTSIGRGLLIAPFTAYAMGYYWDWHQNRHMYKQNVFFHYALMKEKEMPVIQRIKYGEIIRDWTPHRSLHQLGEGNFQWW